MPGSWTSNLLSFVTGSRKRRAQEDTEEDVEPAVSKKARAEVALLESAPPVVSSFSYRAPNKNITLNDSLLSIPDSFSSKPPVFDLRHKIKTPSRTKSILAELTKYSSNPNSSKNNLHLFENSRWMDSSSKSAAALPPRRSTFTPSRIQQISANMNRTFKANKSSWNSSLLNDTVANGSRLTMPKKDASFSNESNTLFQESEARSDIREFDSSDEPHTEVAKVSNGPTTNKFGLTDLDNLDGNEDELVFSFDPPEVRAPRRYSVSPSPTESSSKSDLKKNSSDSESSSTSAESDDLEIIEPKKPEEPTNDMLSKPAGKKVGVLKPEKWTCKNCLNKNEIDLQQCKGCQYDKNGKKAADKVEPVSKQIPEPVVTSIPTTAGKLGNQWECPTCMVRNKPEASECPCCGTAKPGAAGSASVMAPKPAAPAFKPTKFSSDASSLKIFGLGNGTSSGSSLISFGVTEAKNTPAATTAQSSAPLFGGLTTTTSNPLFSGSTTVASSIPSIPVFGATVSTTSTPSVSSSISSVLKDAPKFPSLSSTSTTSTTSPFAFGSTGSSSNSLSVFGSTSNAPAVSTAASSSGKGPFLFGQNPGGTSELFPKPSSGSFLFGGQNGTSAVPKDSSNTGLSGASVSNATASVSSSGFDFGSSSLKSGFNFGGTSTSSKIGDTPAPAAPAPFAFGSDASSSSNGAAPAPASGAPFVFGGNPNPPVLGNANMFAPPAPAGNVFAPAPAAGGLAAGRKILAARRKMGK
ncbi:unnamed protein product [Bursaphelenchus xylophilus]|uniref:Nuclear pore complex protein Nup153 n=1 Tax=Bursaphelenchus xylophilus TaxID=6326 RepID=A0A1I7S8Y1_BURXY|nr:unnamed protein product [Bursaphelenchus xylophilus]CAG9085999.1 unnamed protein product [Bursaphelenchus xylophilus]